MIWPFTFQLAVQLAGYGHHLIPLADDPKEAEIVWLRCYIAAIDAAATGTTLVLDLLGEPSDSEARKVWPRDVRRRSPASTSSRASSRPSPAD